MGTTRDKKGVTRTAQNHGHRHPHDHSHPHHDHSHGHDHAGGPKRSSPALDIGSGKDHVLFLDAFSGVAGDMLVAALVDLGIPEKVITDAVAPLPLKGYRLKFEKVAPSGISATRFHVEVKAHKTSRDYALIRAMLEGAAHLDMGAKKLALAAFARLAEAEAEVHGGRPDQVSFHEVGAVDSIVDIVATAAALSYLGARVVCSPLPMGRGFIKCRHGIIPAPAPATVLCLRGAPTYDAGIDAELVTPTGACMVAVAASGFCRWPSFASERVGWGAGTRELPDRPNLLRAVLGRESSPRFTDLPPDGQTHVLLETNLDNQSSEIIAYAVQRLFEVGALDVWTTPIGMKKGRAATMVSVLAARGDLDQIAGTLLTETSTLGLRIRDINRIERRRRSVFVATEYGDISVKVADGDGFVPNIAPEYESCRAAADTHRIPIKEVYAAAIAAYRKVT
jgi:uncharacterized protein (TIGR00299 family) protein